MDLIDTHTHLYLREFESDRKDVLSRALEKGINRFFMPNIDAFSISDMMLLAKQHPSQCFPMMGLHPCSVDAGFMEDLQEIEQWLNKEKFYAVGEIGIDLYWDKTFAREQSEAFIHQIDLAKKHKLPIVIHMRNSFREVFDIVNSMNDENLKGIFHCFSGTREEADKIIGLGGFKLGIGGVVTYKNSTLNKIIASIPLEHIVLETDSPYLTPEPHRGKRNESSYIHIIAEKIATLYNKSIQEIAEITTRNARAVFNV